MLDQNNTTFATHCYLTMLRFVTLVYIDKSTDIIDRLFYAWSTVFICRYWWAWLRYKIVLDIEPKSRQNRKPVIKKMQQYFCNFSGLNIYRNKCAHFNIYFIISTEQKITS